jgi:cyclopropane-fatty-acyl-phospholipid synthase
MKTWDWLLSTSLGRLVRHGAFELHYADRRVEHVGEAGAPPVVVVRLHDRRVARELVVHPSLGLGEAYVEGRLTVDDDRLYPFVDLLLDNLADRHHPWRDRLLGPLTRGRRRLAELNPPGRARQNAAHHYDLSDTLYELFLDADRQYSCAYFETPDQDLDSAQAAKRDLIARKLLLRPGHRVLDIGCGWGGLALHLARASGARVTGVTLAEHQLRVATERAARSQLTSTPEFRLEDYRRVEGTFDRIVSVGMFEHVGTPHYDTFFRTVHDRLADDGVALVHTIGRPHGPAPTEPWIAKYIFPGAAIPALSEIVPAVERAGLTLTDLEVWRLHYADTLLAWRRRFEANRDRIRALHDERFCRLWTYYLTISELGFRRGDLVVFQLQLARRQDAAPLTREYLLHRPRAAELRESA